MSRTSRPVPQHHSLVRRRFEREPERARERPLTRARPWTSALRPLRTLSAAFVAGLLIACGGDDVNGPGERPLEDRLALSDSTVQPSAVVLAHFTDVSLPETGLEGQLGGQAMALQRLDDSTAAFLVPAVAAGTHAVDILVGTRTFTAELEVVSPAAITSPEQFVPEALDVALADLDAVMLEGTSIDTATIRRTREALAAARQQFAAASAEDRAAVAAFLAANAEILGLTNTMGGVARAASLGQLSTGTPSAVGDGRCVTVDGQTLYTFHECKQQLHSFLVSHRNQALRLAALGLVGTLVTGPAAPLVSTFVTVMVAKQIIVIADQALKRFIVPVFDAIGESFEGGRAARAAGSWASVAAAAATGFLQRTEQPFVVMGTYRSPSLLSADDPTIAGAIEILRGVFELWNRLAELFPILGSAPEIPETPARTEVAPVPPEFLRLGARNPPAVVGSARASGEDWLLTFDLPGMGKDHEFTFDVSSVERPEKSITIPATLSPLVYAVASVIVPDSIVLDSGATTSLTAVVRDSAGRVLEGRTVRWRTSDASVASVDSVTGMVTARDSGIAMVTATASGEVGDVAAASTRVRVSLETVDPIGSYALVLLNGQPVPAVVASSDTWREEIMSGSLELRADSTFTITYLERDTYLETGATELNTRGASGTWSRSGTTFVFTEVIDDPEYEPMIWSAQFSGRRMTLFVPGGSWVFEKQ